MVDSGVDATAGRSLRVHGVVQGVGFRPFVHRLATTLGLAGHVGNDSEGVFVEVEGPRAAVDAFARRLVEEAPPMARIDRVETSARTPSGGRGFRIVSSIPLPAARAGAAPTSARTFVSPDVAVCDACRRELFDPSDRRYRYPFNNCTNCGPRFTITLRLPYDRPNTTMRGFPLCPACEDEYRNPADRRFHAEPVACAVCGPRLWLDLPGGRVDDSDAAIAGAQRALAAGAIVAVKGVGGYHLACDARSDEAVARLRERKRRPHKPLAVMVADLPSARRFARVSPGEARLLAGPQAPIVLLAKRPSTPLASLVAPDNPLVGVLLAYSPLHHLLFQPVPGVDTSVPRALVMTSGNLSEEPICFDDEDARRRLAPLVDGWLVHDRPIHVPCDDSVVRLLDQREVPVRRSRGWAPLPVRLPFPTLPVLAVGGELKNTFCLADGADAWMSQHIGDMGSLETIAAFERSRRQFADLYRVDHRLVAADAHPGYHTRKWAEDQAASPVALVQHHHAHVASVMAEHGVPPDERVIGFAFDGTGYGTDGAIWGGEALVAGYGDFERARHLRYVPLPGGDSAIRKPYRVALAHLWAAGIDWAPELPPVEAAGAELATLQRQLERDVGCVPTSSMGRLFDAVSSLIGLRHVVSFEAQAAIELETLATEHLPAALAYGFSTRGADIDTTDLLAAIVDDVRHGRPAGSIAAGFHVAVADMILDVAVALRQRAGIEQVALTGGVFQNVLLARLAATRLADHDFRVLTHRVVPPNDGGLALGQAAVAAWRHWRSKEGT